MRSKRNPAVYEWWILCATWLFRKYQFTANQNHYSSNAIVHLAIWVAMATWPVDVIVSTYLACCLRLHWINIFFGHSQLVWWAIKLYEVCDGMRRDRRQVWFYRRYGTLTDCIFSLGWLIPKNQTTSNFSGSRVLSIIWRKCCQTHKATDCLWKEVSVSLSSVISGSFGFSFRVAFDRIHTEMDNGWITIIIHAYFAPRSLMRTRNHHYVVHAYECLFNVRIHMFRTSTEFISKYNT